MKITYDFDVLDAAVLKMGAVERAFIISPIDLRDPEGLTEGKEVPLDDIVVPNEGILTYKGQQVLLYIQDHGGKIEETLIDGAAGKKFHISFCRALERMKSINKFEKYVITNDTSGVFHISGFRYPSNSPLEGDAQLKVCKYCLMNLNYNNYNTDKINAFNKFSLEEFFEKYHTRFKHKPKRRAGGENDSLYTKDWNQISKKYRESKNWQCEQCRVDLSSKKNLLHTHHIDGVKIHNNISNLSALCVICHSEQPDHQHMKKSIKSSDLRLISSLRIGQKDN